MLKQLDHSWCRTLYDALASKLVLYGRSLGLTPAEAEDVLHDTFAALLRLQEVPLEPERYGRRAYRNRALNLRRSWLRRLSLDLHARCWFEPSPDEDPREARAMRELAHLPAAQREAVVLRIWHGCTFKEIGELTGVSQHTAAGRYRYGLSRLRQELEGLEDEPQGCSGAAVGWLDAPTPI